jgi:hypothetical protein
MASIYFPDIVQPTIGAACRREAHLRLPLTSGSDRRPMVARQSLDMVRPLGVDLANTGHVHLATGRTRPATGQPSGPDGSGFSPHRHGCRVVHDSGRHPCRAAAKPTPKTRRPCPVTHGSDPRSAHRHGDLRRRPCLMGPVLTRRFIRKTVYTFYYATIPRLPVPRTSST